MPRVSIRVYGLELLNRQLETLAQAAVGTAKYALHPGAGIAAVKLKTAVDALQTVSDKQAMGSWQKRRACLICESQKDALRKNIGVAPMRHRGSTVGTKVGFSGYNQIATHKYPEGQPNIMIAASCDHGSSAMLPQPFIKAAYNLCEKPAQEAMTAAAEEFINRILKNS